MNAERWRKIETLFQQAAELEPAARRVLLERACGDDAELRPRATGRWRRAAVRITARPPRPASG